MDWFRSYHGTPTDPKWIAVARQAGTQPGVVAAIWWALLDRASQASPRGSVEGFDVEGVAAFFGWDDAAVQSVINVLRKRGLIETGETGETLRNWRKRNPTDYSTERVRAHRERKKNDLLPEGETLGNEGNARNAREHRGEDTKKEKNPSGSKRRRRQPETELPDEWVPTEAHRQKALAAKLDVKREAEKFRNNHEAKGSLFRNWDKAFHTWLDNAVEFRSSRGPPKAQASPGRLKRDDTYTTASA